MHPYKSIKQQRNKLTICKWGQKCKYNTNNKCWFKHTHYTPSMEKMYKLRQEKLQKQNYLESQPFFNEDISEDLYHNGD